MKHGSEISSSITAKTFLVALGVAGALAFSASAFAMSNGGGGGGTNTSGPSTGGTNGSASTAPVVCKTGLVFDDKTKRCVNPKTGALDDRQLYEQGRALAVAGFYDNALVALEAVKDQHDSMVLTMIGYSKRKLGHYDEGLGYYRQALAINPDNANTREYLGEAFAEKGKLDLAKAELVKVEAICGTECEQYQDLAAVIAGTPKVD